MTVDPLAGGDPVNNFILGEHYEPFMSITTVID